jgi:hypothetical protein
MVNKEKEVQKALGTLPKYHVCVFGPRRGFLIRWVLVEALTPQDAIYVACKSLPLGVRRRFLKTFQNTYAQSNYGIQRFLSARVGLANSTDYSTIDYYVFNNLCLILTFDGELRDDIPDDILKKYEVF